MHLVVKAFRTIFVEGRFTYLFATIIVVVMRLLLFINKEVDVLIEETKDGYSLGHTGEFLYVKINKELPHNEIVKVTIKKVEYPYCIGME